MNRIKSPKMAFLQHEKFSGIGCRPKLTALACLSRPRELCGSTYVAFFVGEPGNSSSKSNPAEQFTHGNTASRRLGRNRDLPLYFSLMTVSEAISGESPMSAVLTAFP